MKNVIRHQVINTTAFLLTTYRYGASSNPGPIGQPHFHKNYELLIPINGISEVTVDGQIYRIQSGEAIMIHPFQIHCIQIAPDAQLWCSVFSAQLVGGLNAILEGSKSACPVFHPSPVTTDFFLAEMRRYFSDWHGWRELTPPQQMAAKACLYAVGGEYVSQASLSSDRKDDKTSSLATNVARYISQNYKNDVSLQDVAKELGYSYQYLSKMFRSLFGIHFKALLNQYRAERALRMLQETSLPITRVAFESGFQSLRSFNHVCVGIFGQTPTDLRRRAHETRL